MKPVPPDKTGPSPMEVPFISKLMALQGLF
jgi:hypothetical protein